VTAKGRLLGVDFGTVRVGLAVCDPDRIIASPLATYARRNAELDGRYFRDLARAEGVAGLVVGLPVHMSGQEGQKAAEARAFGRWLGELTGLPVAFWDERYTSVEAERHLWNAGLTHQRRKDRRDRVAAQLLLQSYLEAGCPAESAPGPIDGEPAA
jgi:putative Holliday junction resolvase